MLITKIFDVLIVFHDFLSSKSCRWNIILFVSIILSINDFTERTENHALDLTSLSLSHICTLRNKILEFRILLKMGDVMGTIM